MEITDIHCHILPGIDDGAQTETESFRMLKMAYEQGIHTFFATAHASHSYPDSRPDVIVSKCKDLEKQVQKTIGAEIRIHSGQEILFSDSVLNRLDKGELLTLAGSSYVLLEFFPTTSYTVIRRVIREFSMSVYDPVLAHIERYEALREEGRVEELIENGAYMQMNYRTIGGKWYEQSVRWCRDMLKNENIHFLGTDMHNTSYRAPDTKAAVKWLKKHLEESYLKDICTGNAEKVLQNTRI